MRLEIEVNVDDDAADKAALQEHLRKEAILALFADRRIPVGKAAHELGLSHQNLTTSGRPDSGCAMTTIG
jgi:hypothetical protein